MEARIETVTREIEVAEVVLRLSLREAELLCEAVYGADLEEDAELEDAIDSLGEALRAAGIDF